jgi:hypothetical protein
MTPAFRRLSRVGVFCTRCFACAGVAGYAEFGPFYLGLRVESSDLPRLLEGQMPEGRRVGL